MVNLPRQLGVGMTNTDSGGGWTQFKITGASNGKCFITAPDGPKRFQRLRFTDGGRVGTAKSHNTDPEFQLVITEAGAGKTALKDSEPTDKKP